jgi:hypothetical protein
MTKPKTGRSGREDREKLLVLKHKFESRITVAKHGKESLDSGDYGNAIKRFVEYLSTVAEVKGVPDIYSLRVSHFDAKKDLTEMLMISHVFFEMARVYDAVPKFSGDAQKCLDQFVHFSANQPYQIVNSEMIRKHLKKSVFKNTDAFRNAYQQIFVQSKKCYVVTFCFGEHHPTTLAFRELKDLLLGYPLGRDFIQIYYRVSSDIVPKWEGKLIPCLVSRIFLVPLLNLFSKTLLRLIIK